ncbi:hypothetical protein JCM21714_4047 [Gracilibacillus boraciitolerans JCM 21714]|uniref:Uncharacterized protein n=1 Tax=Gracilibacillus boraciitolerans JCM 21714 TaxID=1298598 RepID=W4VN57_9BACI|nr:hypothetical protein JCM21714_4047 [Gracilibacillus boraciitolerans JCM 21714]
MDASGHAGAINEEMDGVEQRLKEKSHAFAKHFSQFYIKTVELTGYLRSYVNGFPVLKRFNNTIEGLWGQARDMDNRPRRGGSGTFIRAS